MKQLVLCTGLVLGMVALTTPSVDGAIAVGASVPSVELEGSDGKTYNPADFKDKQAIVIAWYPKAFTGG